MDACPGVGERDELFDAVIGVAGAAGLVDGAVDVEGDPVGEAEAGDLGGGLDAAATGSDGARGGELERRAGMADCVGEVEGDCVIEAEGAGRDVDLAEGAFEDCERVFVFVPLVGEGCFGFRKAGEDFGEMVALEGRADDEGRGGFGEDVGEEALGLAPVGAGEVEERGAGGEEDGVDAEVAHEFAGAVVAGSALLFGDGVDVGAAILQGEDGRGERGGVCGG